jgi:hypothetical protein
MRLRGPFVSTGALGFAVLIVGSGSRPATAAGSRHALTSALRCRPAAVRRARRADLDGHLLGVTKHATFIVMITIATLTPPAAAAAAPSGSPQRSIALKNRTRQCRAHH